MVGRGAVKRSGWWGLLVVVVLAGWGLARLRFDADALNLLPGDLPVVRGLQWHQQHFAGAQELLITLSGPDPEALATTAREIAGQLRARPDLVRAVHAFPPWQEKPADAAENLAWLWLQQPPAAVDALIQRLEPATLARQLAETRETLATSLDPAVLARASYDPLGLTQLPLSRPPPGAGMDAGVGTFQNADGTFRLIQVEPAVARLPYRAAARWLAEVRTEVNALPNLPTVQFTGGPVFLAEIALGMESDLTSSVVTTLGVIGLLFWIAHRSFRPLVGLVGALAVTLLGTLALGGWWFGTLNVISAGFAAVLLGLVVDYGLVGYQEARAHPGLSLREIRRRTTPGIAWSAVTTAGTFALLRWAGLPGLAQLGTLTALGLLLGAVVMVFGFLPLAVRGIQQAQFQPKPVVPLEPGALQRHARWGLVATGVILVLAGVVLAVRGWPRATGSTTPLRPRQSQAYTAMEQLTSRLGRTNELRWLLFPGTSPGAVAHTLESADRVLAGSLARGEIISYTVPRDFWPRPDNARTNLAAAATLAGARERLRAAAVTAGFTAESLVLDEAMVASWSAWTEASSRGAPLWPTNATAAWLRRQFASEDGHGGWLALGLVEPGRTPFAAAELPPEVIVSGWDLLGPALLERVSGRVRWLTGVILLVITVSLGLAFRRWTEVLLGLMSLATALGLLLAMMSAVGAEWNLLSLVAIPLLLGSSVDSTIHVQLALRRGGGWIALWRTTGRALVLCAGANIAGFGSLAWSNNAGLASLDIVCAGGVFCVLLVALGLLPAWWWATVGRRQLSSAGGVDAVGDASHADAAKPGVAGSEIAGPSALYSAVGWRVGGWLIRWLPRGVAVGLARVVVEGYRRGNPSRDQIVRANLVPLLGDSPLAVARWSRRNFSEFAIKLVDLWRFEAGVDVSQLVQPGSGWEHFQAAQASGQGVLLVTPHLGNWEFGAVLLRERGIRPLVLTAPEPGRGLTELRAHARGRQHIDTLVVGADPFAFVEVIRRLQSGGVVAVLVDRPAAATAVEVELCGRPFAASIAAAELARATGCRILPTYIVREGPLYRAHVLPPVAYDRRELNNRPARARFTGDILRAFEPVLRQYPDQWFHFVPVWPRPSGEDPGPRV